MSEKEIPENPEEWDQSGIINHVTKKRSCGKRGLSEKDGMKEVNKIRAKAPRRNTWIAEEKMDTHPTQRLEPPTPVVRLTFSASVS